MSEYIKRQDAIDTVAKSYPYESDRMTALQELPVRNIKKYHTKENSKLAKYAMTEVVVLMELKRNEIETSYAEKGIEKGEKVFLARFFDGTEGEVLESELSEPEENVSSLAAEGKHIYLTKDEACLVADLIISHKQSLYEVKCYDTAVKEALNNHQEALARLLGKFTA